MKMKSVALLTLCAFGAHPMEAARRKPTKAGVPAKATKDDMKPLFKAIESADLKKVDEQVAGSGAMLNEHNGEFSPLGKAHRELRENRNTDLSRTEKTARTRRLKKIIGNLEENGATLIYDNSGPSKAPKAKKA